MQSEIAKWIDKIGKPLLRMVAVLFILAAASFAKPPVSEVNPTQPTKEQLSMAGPATGEEARLPLVKGLVNKMLDPAINDKAGDLGSQRPAAMPPVIAPIDAYWFPASGVSPVNSFSAIAVDIDALTSSAGTGRPVMTNNKKPAFSQAYASVPQISARSSNRGIEKGAVPSSNADWIHPFNGKNNAYTTNWSDPEYTPWAGCHTYETLRMNSPAYKGDIYGWTKTNRYTFGGKALFKESKGEKCQ